MQNAHMHAHNTQSICYTANIIALVGVGLNPAACSNAATVAAAKAAHTQQEACKHAGTHALTHKHAQHIPLTGASGMNPPACSAAAAAAAANALRDAVLLLLLLALTATESPARARAFFLFFCPLVRFGLCIWMRRRLLVHV